MEWPNEKYWLDCFSDSELDSESEERENYRYEQKYETHIWTINITRSLNYNK